MCNKGQRNKSDFYQTPHSMTEQLLENEVFDYTKSVFEPACGKGAIVCVIANNFKKFYYQDIQESENYDFLNYEGNYDYIITNPPFSLAFEFIQKAKEVAKVKFAMLLPLSFLHGQKRYEEKIFRFAEYPLTKVYVFTRYPLLTDKIREDGKYNTGMMVYAWFIWEKRKLKDAHGISINYKECPVVKWIDNNKYVLRNGE